LALPLGVVAAGVRDREARRRPAAAHRARVVNGYFFKALSAEAERWIRKF
jgi:hypothetical protein